MKYGDSGLKGRKRLFVHAIKESAQGSVAAARKAKRCARKIAEHPASFSQVQRQAGPVQPTRGDAGIRPGDRWLQISGQGRTLVTSIHPVSIIGALWRRYRRRQKQLSSIHISLLVGQPVSYQQFPHLRI